METGANEGERRATERFCVALPVETDGGPGMTRDVSVSGLFVVVDHRLEAGSRLSLVMTMPGRDRTRTIRLGLDGRVVRVEDAGGRTGAGIVLEGETLSLLNVS